MSLFPGAFDNDPFFRGTGFPPSMFGRDPFEGMFGVPRQQAALTNGRPTQRSGQRDEGQQQLMLRDPFQSMFPFGGGLSPFGSMFQNMERMMQQAASNPNAHTFSSTSVMHYSSNGAGGGQPRVYQASSSIRQAPGGIRETRKTVQDSESGTRKMAIGHHIGDRSHVIEKRHNVRTQEREEHQQFVNLDEDDAGNFDHEWKQRTSTFNSRYHPSSLQDGGHRHQARGLPAPRPSDIHVRRPHVGEKRKHRPPSLVHDDDNEEDIQYVTLDHPSNSASDGAPHSRPRATPYVRLDHPSMSDGASHSRPRAPSYERREAGLPRVGEPSSSRHPHHHHGHHQQQRHYPEREQAFAGTSSRHSQAAGAREHTQHRRQPAINPELERLGGVVGGIPPYRQLREQHYGGRGTEQQRQPEEYRVDPSVRLRGREANSSKRHKQRSVNFE